MFSLWGDVSFKDPVVGCSPSSAVSTSHQHYNYRDSIALLMAILSSASKGHAVTRTTVSAHCESPRKPLQS